MDIVDYWKELFDIRGRCTTYHFFKEENRKIEIYFVSIVFTAVLFLMLFLMPDDLGLDGLMYQYINVFVLLVMMFMLNVHLRYRMGIIRFGKNKFTLKEAEMYAKFDLFKRRYHASDKLKCADINSLIEWGENRIRQQQHIEGIISKLIPVLVAVFGTYIFGLEKTKKWAEDFFEFAFYFAPVIIPYLVAFKESSMSVNKQYFLVCQQLRWLEIEEKNKASHFELNGGPG